MPSGKLAFKETDVARAIRAAVKAGLEAFHVRIEKATGDILVLPGRGLPVQGVRPQPTNDDDLDRELAEWEAKQKA